ncbi:unnamed protein product (macronuclear) [Paramecium tetraurelia]|uniref:Kinesin motor domain-containing protein n=1 Tax=Paramecium tetraurelia TaxID=5888 RepID=A0DBV0_PARTE|nr:uncharacterized protein GSPATT00015394001 [Paramecium tetraurelia]CAK80517.1 unnamed protein product [Paramecium tetraurelia]|eukprot:XP_001447914.1 hypothetical protein (macronuclear) [Paramecium tetraurelia strain d4-2]
MSEKKNLSKQVLRRNISIKSQWETKNLQKSNISSITFRIRSEQQKNETQTQKASPFYDTLQQEDCFRTNAILNVQLSVEDALKQYKQDGIIGE